MMEPVARFTISIPPDLLTQFDEVCAGKGYASRSEAVRDAIRDYLVAHEWTSGEGAGTEDVVGTVTLVYDHETRGVSDELLRQQHEHHGLILSALHVHLDAHNCLEVIVLRGARDVVSSLADLLISQRGVKFGRLVCATSGSGLL